MIKSTIVFFLLSVFAHAEIKEENGVLVLDDSNFDDAIKANDFLLVEFYAPWCGHCKKLAPEWDSAAKTLAGSNAKLAKVDATEAKDLGTRFGIKGFPTIKLFKHGEASEYQGGRQAADIVNYLKKATGPPAKFISTSAELEALEEENEVFVVGYFADAQSDAAKAFLTVASKDDDTVYATTSSDEIKNKFALSGDAILLLKTAEAERVDYPISGDFDKAAVETFIAANRLPLINEFSPENSKKIFGSSIKKHGLFFTIKDAEHHTTTVNAMRTLGTAYRGKVLMVRVPSTENKVLEYFGLKSADLPAFVLADMSGEGGMKKFFYSGSYDDASLNTFMEDFLAGNLKQVLKSEPIAPEDTTGPVKIVKGESFNDIVINNKNDVLVEFYAPWCGHCKKLAPVWDELGAQLANVPTVTIAKTDATANEFDVPGLNVKGFPTIYFFKGDDKTPKQYNGGREVEDFVEFLAHNAATPFEHAHNEL